jgi:hypothetical protein
MNYQARSILANLTRLSRANANEGGHDPRHPTADALRAAAREAKAAEIPTWEIAQAVNYDAP